jgi:hypothetical protein
VSVAGPRPGPPALAAAATNVHRDERWWLKCLVYGAAALTGLGLPIAAGFVMESLDNSRRGYPTPLPPWSDPSLRWITGLFCLLIDFSFIVLPLIVGGLLVLCVSISLVLATPQGSADINLALTLISSGAGAFTLALFLASVSPAGRLIFAREGKIEEAISAATPRWTLGAPQRGSFLRARLASLPAYLPALALAGATAYLSRFNFPAQGIALALGIWLTLSALVYAHLIVVQLYVAAERDIQRRALGMDRA